MDKKDVVTEVNERIDELIAKRNGELETIENAMEKINDKVNAAMEAMDAATDSMNVEAYEEANATYKREQISLDMYMKRSKRLDAKEFVTEEDSDSVIDSLLNHEKDLEKDYKESITSHINALADITNQYFADIQNTENTIRRWTKYIHENYRSATTTYSDGTNRSPHPVPVHAMPFMGCSTAIQMKTFIEKL